MELWFERRGRVEHDFIRYDAAAMGVDSAVMSQQGKLDAGPLFGLASLHEVAEGDIDSRPTRLVRTDCAPSRNESSGSSRSPLRDSSTLYAANTDRTGCQRSRRDSRECSIGYFCKDLKMQWRRTDGSEWHPLVPDEPQYIFRAERPPRRRYAEFLTEGDWSAIRDGFSATPTPLSVILIGRAHELVTHGHTREAIVQAVTALEVALQESRDWGPQKTRQRRAAAQFLELPLGTRLAVALTFMGATSGPEWEGATKAIDVRNKVVHEGADAPDDVRNLVEHVGDCVALLLRLTELKRPILDSGNSLHWKA